jgi:ubiquinone/menaquinone biosynthesis C-methylase UbiE
MTEVQVIHNDGASYDRFMGQWSRAAGAMFLEWLAPPKGVRWLDIGCGTGVFTDLVLRTCEPLSIDGLDSQLAQIERARSQLPNERVTFLIGDAHNVPFADDTYDIVSSALVLNFLANPLKAVNEMRRVARPGAIVAAYVWDFASELTPNSCLCAGLRQLAIEVPRLPGIEFPNLINSFHRTAYRDITTQSFDVSVSFNSFEDFWKSQTPDFSPITKTIATLQPSDKAKLVEIVRKLSLSENDRAEWSARVHGIRSHVP